MISEVAFLNQQEAEDFKRDEEEYESSFQGQDLHLVVGLIKVEPNYLGEEQYMGTDAQWRAYEELIN